MLDSKALANNLTTVIVNPLIALLFAAGLVVFSWGVVEFLWGMNSSGEASGKEEGKQHMLWGIVGMFVMASAYAILKLLDNSVGSNLVH